MTAKPPPQVGMARIVHDLRNPLMPLQTAAWLLRNEAGEAARVRELAEVIERQSARLGRMLDELGDWERGLGGELARNLETVDARLLLDLAIGGVRDCQVDPSFVAEAADARLRADIHRLQQMLQSLIEHAVQRGGGRAPAIEVGLDGQRLWIRIRDHGPALDAGAQEDLFAQPQARPFDQGLGLRLLLARAIAEAHGGGLSAAGADDGLVVSCWLPVAA